MMCVIAVSGCGRARAPVVETPATVVGQFYHWRVTNRLAGAPTSAQLERIKPLLSHELQVLLQRTAKSADARVNVDTTSASARRNRKKPEFIDGDVFSSLSEGPTSFKMGAIEPLEHDAHYVEVRLASAKQVPAVNWIDRVKVIQEDGHYVLADIEYANHWYAGGTGTLLKSLKEPEPS